MIPAGLHCSNFEFWKLKTILSLSRLPFNQHPVSLKRHGSLCVCVCVSIFNERIVENTVIIFSASCQSKLHDLHLWNAEVLSSPS